ncbi:hypothetical protein [Catellatospora paridis]|uniref:hypothetical protein n=1 Tax=Catellatospora paridis TaxID=1617086 RepID=UPI0012D41793|nr:hypothetical protein [Catellatospora paridis]
MPSVRAAVRYYEQNLGWTPLAGAFAGGTLVAVGGDAAAEPVTRCNAFRLPDCVFEPPFEDFKHFGQ